MGIEGHPFLVNMLASSLPKGKFKVLTSERAREAKAVDSTRQISAAQYQKKHERQISRSDFPETSKSDEMRNKWQRQKEKEQMRQERDYWRFQEEYERRRIQEEDEYHWNCPFFQHCWNKGLELPTLNNSPKCRDQYWEYRQAKLIRRPVHERLNFGETNQRIKMENIHDRLKTEIADQETVDREYVW